MKCSSHLTALVVAFVLVGCTTNPNGTLTTPSIPASLVNDAQADARALCGVIPTAESIAALFATGAPELALADSIANIVCGAVPKALRRNSRRAMLVRVPQPIVIHGVTVTFQGAS